MDNFMIYLKYFKLMEILLLNIYTYSMVTLLIGVLFQFNA